MSFSSVSVPMSPCQTPESRQWSYTPDIAKSEVMSEAELAYVYLKERLEREPHLAQTIVQLKSLCKENAQIKLRMKISNLTGQLSSLNKNITAMFQQQKALHEQLQANRRDKAPNLGHTMLDSLADDTEALHNIVFDWAALRTGITRNKWFRECLVEQMTEYNRYSKLFLNQVKTTAQLIRSMTMSGLQLLCQLLPSQISDEFLCKTLVGCNEFNLMLKTVHKLLTNCGASEEQLVAEFKMDQLLKKLATYDGQYLADFIVQPLEQLKLEIGPYELPPPSDYFKKVTQAMRPVLYDVLPSSADCTFRTSDYGSSTASLSSHGHPDMLNPLRVAKQNPYSDLRKKLQTVYSTFMAHKYSLFLALMRTAAPCRELGERLKQRRRALWNDYVTTIWDAYQETLVNNLRIGKHSAVCTLLCHPFFKHSIMTVINEAIMSVRLSESFEPPMKAMRSLAADLEQQLRANVVDEFLTNQRVDKGVIRPESLVKSWEAMRHYTKMTMQMRAVQMSVVPSPTPTSTSSQPSLISTMTAISEPHETAIQLGYWMAATIQMRLLADYNVSAFLFNQNLELATARHIGSSLIPKTYRTESHQFLCSKVVHFTKQQIDIMGPPKIHWNSTHRGETEETYVANLCTTVLGPFELGLSKLSRSHRAEWISETVAAFIQGWMGYFFEHQITLDTRGLQYLTRDLNQAQKWLAQNTAFGERRLTVFKQVTAEIDRARQRQSQVAVVFRNNKVNPEPKRTSEPTCEIVLPTAVQWNSLKNMRSPSPFFSCFGACFRSSCLINYGN